MGGDVKGGQAAEVAGLNDHQSNDGRDLALTTDLRAVVGEFLTKHLGVKNLAPVFWLRNNAAKFPGLVRA